MFANRPGALLRVLAVTISLTFQILLPVVPALVERNGPHGIAGAATAALFLGAVAGELSSPSLMTFFSSRRLIVAGQLVTAVSSLAYLLPGAGTSLMIGAAAVRGVGMGIAIVIATALIAELTHPSRRGRSIGSFGLALSVPGIFVPSIGVFLLAGGHENIDALIAAVSSVVGVVAALGLPEKAPQPRGDSANLLAAIRRPGLAMLFAGYVLVSCSYGGSLTFVPVALPLDGLGSAATYLLVSGATRATGRLVAGMIVDRVRARTVLAGSVLLCLLGLIALAQHGSGWVVVFAGLVYGAGYGSVQTAAYIALLERGTARDSGAISALWNCGIDLGSSLGGVLIGLAAARAGFSTAAWVLPAVVLVSAVLILRPGPPVQVGEPAAGEPVPLQG